jgi:hypothetical protein
MDIITVLKNVALGDDGYAELVRLNLRHRVDSSVSSALNAWDVVGALLRQNVTIGAAQVAFASLDGTIPLTEVGRGLRAVWYE